MTFLNWVGPEADIGQSCTVCGFVVEKLEKKGGGIQAEGTITTVDYGEHGWDFDYNWTAVSEDGIIWTVEHSGLGGEKSTFSIKDCEETRRRLFSGVPFGHKILETKWIIAMLQELLEKGREALEITEYDGSLDPWNGDCFCQELVQDAGRYIWQKFTQGNFAKNCLLCSCGESWHFHKSRGWTRASKKAFELLTKYNGVATRSMIISEGIPRIRLQSETSCHYV